MTSTATDVKSGTGCRMAGRRKPGGWLAVMTGFRTHDARFAGQRRRWGPTHAAFGRAAASSHIAAVRGRSCEMLAQAAVPMRRPSAGSGRP